MGRNGAPSPGMVFVEKQARFTPIRELGRRRFFEKITRRPPQTRQRGALAAQISLRRNGMFGACESSFYGFMILPGRPRFRWISGYLKTQGPNP